MTDERVTCRKCGYDIREITFAGAKVWGATVPAPHCYHMPALTPSRGDLPVPPRGTVASPRRPSSAGATE